MTKNFNATCTRCLKPENLCLCEWIQPIQTQTQFLILQHPQEPDHELGSARIAHLCLPQSVLKIGLSWPNLSKALGKPANSSDWGILYLGTGLKEPKHDSISYLNKKGEITSPKKSLLGYVILDGSWSQAKALWWRNPWLLKLQRVVLSPSKKSLYQELRKEPRKECLSTLESIVEILRSRNEPEESSQILIQLFSKLLNKKRNLIS